MIRVTNTPFRRHSGILEVLPSRVHRVRPTSILSIRKSYEQVVHLEAASCDFEVIFQQLEGRCRLLFETENRDNAAFSKVETHASAPPPQGARRLAYEPLPGPTPHFSLTHDQIQDQDRSAGVEGGRNYLERTAARPRGHSPERTEQQPSETIKPNAPLRIATPTLRTKPRRP